MKLRLIDTPGLRTSSADIQYNSRIMGQAKKYCNKHKPDITLYFDRLDIPLRWETAGYHDFETSHEHVRSWVWFNAIVVLTHAAGAPPDGPNGQPMSVRVVCGPKIARRSTDCSSRFRRRAFDEPGRVGRKPLGLQNKQNWRQSVTERSSVEAQLLLLCFASKILAQANTLLKLDDGTQMLKKRQTTAAAR